MKIDPKAWLALALIQLGCLAPAEPAQEQLVGVPVAANPRVKEVVPPKATQPESPFDELAQPMYFSNACESAKSRVVVGFVGDVLLHKRLQRQASYTRKRYKDLFREGIHAAFELGDIMYANLEGPVAAGVNADGEEVEDPGMKFDDVVYSSYPRFNYHWKIIEALVDLDVDVVSTANNHAMDRQSIGVDRTIDALTKRGLKYFGTRKHKPRHLPFHTTTTANNIEITWVGCTYGFSGGADQKHQIRQCGREESRLLEEIRELSKTTDALIVTPHWGKEYQPLPREEERAAARRMLDAGALAVVASHPHVLQPWEKYRSGERETFIMHSMGNFVSNQRDLERRSSVVLYLEISKTDEVVTLTGAQYLPIHTAIAKDHHMFVEPVNEETHPEAWNHVVKTMGESNRVPKSALKLDFRSACKPPESKP